LSTRRLGGEPRRTTPSACEPVRGTAADLGTRRVKVVAIGASTGGPQALSIVLAELPADTEAAVVVVQHMADGFIEGLAHWLDGLCPLPVSVATTGRRLMPGSVSIAPSGVNLIVHNSLRVTMQEPAATQYHVPGIDETTFKRLADDAKKNCPVSKALAATPITLTATLKSGVTA